MYGTAWKEDATEALRRRRARRRVPRDRHREPAQALPRGRRSGRWPSCASGRPRATSCSCRRSSRSSTGRTIGCRTTRARRSPSRSRSPSRARSSTSGSRARQPTCCTARRCAHGLGPRRPRGVARDGGAREPARATARHQQRHRAPAARAARVRDVRPAFVQNRCYAQRGWDREVRAFCRAARHRLPGLLAAHREPRRRCAPIVAALAAPRRARRRRSSSGSRSSSACCR